MKIEVGMQFNHKGITWKITKVGKTQSEATAVTKSQQGQKGIIDNKIIMKSKPTMKENDQMNENKRMQELAGVALTERVKPPKRDIDSVMMDLESLIEEAWETMQYHFGEQGVDEVSYRKAEKAFVNMHKEYLKAEKEV